MNLLLKYPLSSFAIISWSYLLLSCLYIDITGTMAYYPTVCMLLGMACIFLLLLIPIISLVQWLRDGKKCNRDAKIAFFLSSPFWVIMVCEMIYPVLTSISTF